VPEPPLPGQSTPLPPWHCRTVFEELGLPRPQPPTATVRDFDAQLDAALQGGAACSALPSECCRRQHGRGQASGLLLAGTATTVDEARHLERAASM
jgi:hypothetical protein